MARVRDYPLLQDLPIPGNVLKSGLAISDRCMDFRICIPGAFSLIKHWKNIGRTGANISICNLAGCSLCLHKLRRKPVRRRKSERNPFAWKRILEQFWKNCMIGKIVRETLRYPKRYAKILDNILYKNK